jgi:hypothetical protein
MWQLYKRSLQFSARVQGASPVPSVYVMIILALGIVELVSLFVGGGTGGQMRVVAGYAWLVLVVFYLSWFWLRWRALRK